MEKDDRKPFCFLFDSESINYVANYFGGDDLMISPFPKGQGAALYFPRPEHAEALRQYQA